MVAPSFEIVTSYWEKSERAGGERDQEMDGMNEGDGEGPTEKDRQTDRQRSTADREGAELREPR